MPKHFFINFINNRAASGRRWGGAKSQSLALEPTIITASPTKCLAQGRGRSLTDIRPLQIKDSRWLGDFLFFPQLYVVNKPSNSSCWSLIWLLMAIHLGFAQHFGLPSLFLHVLYKWSGSILDVDPPHFKSPFAQRYNPEKTSKLIRAARTGLK